jgi:hypothetical protein
VLPCIPSTPIRGVRRWGNFSLGTLVDRVGCDILIRTGLLIAANQEANQRPSSPLKGDNPIRPQSRMLHGALREWHRHAISTLRTARAHILSRKYRCIAPAIHLNIIIDTPQIQLPNFWSEHVHSSFSQRV